MKRKRRTETPRASVERFEADVPNAAAEQAHCAALGQPLPIQDLPDGIAPPWRMKQIRRTEAPQGSLVERFEAAVTVPIAGHRRLQQPNVAAAPTTPPEANPRAKLITKDPSIGPGPPIFPYYTAWPSKRKEEVLEGAKVAEGATGANKKHAKDAAGEFLESDGASKKPLRPLRLKILRSVTGKLNLTRAEEEWKETEATHKDPHVGPEDAIPFQTTSVDQWQLQEAEEPQPPSADPSSSMEPEEAIPFRTMSIDQLQQVEEPLRQPPLETSIVSYLEAAGLGSTRLAEEIRQLRPGMAVTVVLSKLAQAKDWPEKEHGREFYHGTPPWLVPQIVCRAFVEKGHGLKGGPSSQDRVDLITKEPLGPTVFGAAAVEGSYFYAGTPGWTFAKDQKAPLMTIFSFKANDWERRWRNHPNQGHKHKAQFAFREEDVVLQNLIFVVPK